MRGLAAVIRVIRPLTPKGVEHITIMSAREYIDEVIRPLTPKGVEHAKRNADDFLKG